MSSERKGNLFSNSVLIKGWKRSKIKCFLLYLMTPFSKICIKVSRKVSFGVLLFSVFIKFSKLSSNSSTLGISNELYFLNIRYCKNKQEKGFQLINVLLLLFSLIE